MTNAAHDPNDDDYMAAILGDRRPPPPPWPPNGFTPPTWKHPVESWVDLLYDHGITLASDLMHFPAKLAVTEIDYRGTRHRVVLLGLRILASALPSMSGGIPTRGDGDGNVWGGVIEIDGADSLYRRDLWCAGSDGERAATRSHELWPEHTVHTLATAVVATEGMSIRRYILSKDGNIVAGSTEEWRIEAGQLRKLG